MYEGHIPKPQSVAYLLTFDLIIFKGRNLKNDGHVYSVIWQNVNRIKVQVQVRWYDAELLISDPEFSTQCDYPQ